MDGEITIGTKLDTDKFDRQISQLEKKMKKEEDKKIIIDAKLGSQQQELDEARQKADALADAYQRLKEAQNKVSTGQATPKEFTTFQDLQNTYGSLEKLGASLDKALTKQNAIEQKVAQTKYRYDEINAKVSEYKQKIENVKIQKQVADVEKLKSAFNSVGSSIQKSIKDVAKLALGIFGLRSAYMALRRASSDLASYDQQYATNLEYIRYALTQMIAPVLRWIVSMAATLLKYINMIINALFGVNLFASGSAENFNKMKAGASGVSKAVKEIKKQLTGFDEINMLTDQSDTGTSAGAGGVKMPEFDLSALEGEPPEWLKWIVDNKDLILAALAGIAAGLLAIKLGATPLLALGIGLMVMGIVYAVEGLLGYLESPTWKNFGKIIQGIGIAIIGLGAIIGSLPVAVAGAVVLIFGTIIKYWDKIKAFLQGGIDWLWGKVDWVEKMFGSVGKNIYILIVTQLQNALDYFDAKFTAIKGQFDGLIEFITGVFTGDWEKAWNGIKQGFTAWWEGIKKQFQSGTIEMGKAVGRLIGNALKGIVNIILIGVEQQLNTPIRAINGLLSAISKIPGVPSLPTLNTIKLPRLASGGIINIPNKGTLVGSAIAGESGREGVLPLTDQQAMAELGAEIGRNVIVNLTNITKVGNRQIAREIKQINAEQEFAFNS